MPSEPRQQTREEFTRHFLNCSNCENDAIAELDRKITATNSALARNSPITGTNVVPLSYRENLHAIRNY